MNNENLTMAALSALSLLKSEVDTIEWKDLRLEYLQVIDQLEDALKATEAGD